MMNEAKTCGRCTKFDRYNASRQPVSSDGTQGFCRAPLGLILGIRNTDSPCPTGYPQYFVPTADIISADTYVPVDI